MNHTGMAAHDGYVEHSHEVRPDHKGVVVMSTPGAPRETYTILSYVVQGRASGKDWLTLQYAGEEEPQAQAVYKNWLRARGSLEIRLIRRVAVVTDEILAEGDHGSSCLEGGWG